MTDKRSKTNLEFEKIIPTNLQIDTLYSLLARRVHKISHEDLPSFGKHTQFVKDHPYRYWYLIKLDKTYEGTFYIQKNNSIGINVQICNTIILESILTFISGNFTPERPVRSLVSKHFFINVPSSDDKMQQTLKKLGLKMAQVQFHFKSGEHNEDWK